MVGELFCLKGITNKAQGCRVLPATLGEWKQHAPFPERDSHWMWGWLEIPCRE